MLNRLLSSFWFRLLLLAALLLLVLILPARAAPAFQVTIPHGAISGTITDLRTGQPVAGAWAYVYKWNGDKADLLSYSTSTATGYYYVGQLPAGLYKTCFHSSSHVSECYDDWPDGTAATRIAVGVDEIVWNINAALAPAGHIRGKVTEAFNGRPIQGAQVTALKWQYPRWQEAGNALTDATGRYDLSGLPAGSYRLRVSDAAGGYADRYYGGSGAVETASNVGVGTGHTVNGIDVKLLRLGSISGRVQSLSTGEALPGITVTLEAWPPVAPVVTDRLGSYEFKNMKAGDYAVSFTDPTHTYAQCSYSGEAGKCWTKWVRVVDGQATRGINQKLPQTGTLLATVVDATTGAPVPRIVVTLYWNGFYEEISQTTNAAGQVAFTRLELLDYFAYISDPAGGYRATWAAGGAGFRIEPGTNTLTWQMQPATAPNGQRNVRGRVTAADTGEPLAGIQVTAQEEDCDWRNRCDWDPVTSTLTADDGTYEFIDLPLSDRLEATDPAGVYEPEVFSAFHYPEPGETVVADAAMRTVASIYGWIRGRVTTLAGGPAINERVNITRLDTSGWSEWVDVDANGDYRLRVPAGVYRVFFSDVPPYVSEFYDDATSAEAAQPLTVRASETVTANAVIRIWGQITGRVTDVAGNPIRGAWISFFRLSDGYYAYTFTDEEGRYTSPRLADGAYRARFQADGYDSVVWGGGNDIEQGADIAVRANETVGGIDVTLGPPGAIAGRVTDRLTGEPLAGIKVYESLGWTYGVTASDGSYRIPNLRSSQTYEVVARDPTDKYVEQTAPAQVSAPLTTTVDIQLDLPGHIIGRVTDVNGAPLSGIEVVFRQGCCGGVVVKTDGDGRYDSGALRNDFMVTSFRFIVLFRDPTERFLAEYHDNARRQEDATPVTVNPGTRVTVDAALNAAGRISGRVTDRVTGLPIPEVTVSMPIRQYAERKALTAADGTYRLEALPIGPNTLNFSDCCRKYAPVSEPITVTEDMALQGYDIALSPWGVLSGRVTDERTGGGIPRAWVTLYRGHGAAWARAYAGMTDESAAYVFRGLTQGAYRIEFSHPWEWYVAETYPDTPSLGAGADVVFTPGQDTPNIDAALAPTGNAPIELNAVYLPVIVR